ncbi:hypothetical protein Lal_00026154 [Lupinus albus]|uniref:Putative transcription factor C2C2-GATA family n=1 Tax=Lupinus albus TaxID=3870 RepID=A0A6A5LNK7_LUPAL|nr:putative transcription factor C2C2-GATA family [Lupinus albus]KAF1861728.1 hypothetical protein Lal_00026154 [Lupinus albus]
MLYQTPHPLHFQFHPFPSSSSISPLQTTSSILSVPLSKVETEMEYCMEGALKTCLRKDMTVKVSPQTFMEDFNVQNGTPCDDFLFVDNLLDFSHVEQQQDEEEPQQQQHNEGEGEDEGSACVSPKKINENCNLSLSHEFPSLPTTDLSVPEDVADLEWLSNFVEDSFSDFPTVTTTMTENPKTFFAENQAKPLNPVFIQPCFKTPVPAKARSKRTRSGIRVWSLGSPCFTESSTSSTSTSSSSSPTSTLLIYTNLVQNLDQVCSPAKKPKKRVSSDGSVQTPRRCSHCGVQKTPQWRTGPLGAKTLCNACGVRFKSGRLLPEYRPACSPTFSTELHSNHHRKVLEMRRKKEGTGGVETGFAPPPVVPTF